MRRAYGQISATRRARVGNESSRHQIRRSRGMDGEPSSPRSCCVYLGGPGYRTSLCSDAVMAVEVRFARASQRPERMAEGRTIPGECRKLLAA